MKKGQVPSYIGRLILIILGFVILVIFLIALDLKNWSEEELCAASVLARATSPQQAMDLFSLKCTTKKVCLTYGESCYQYANLDKSDIHTIKLDKSNDESSAKKIMEVSADEKYYCWKNMGKGRIDIYAGDQAALEILKGNFWEGAEDLLKLKEARPVCVICSRIALSRDITNTEEGKDMLRLVDTNAYMEENKAPSSEKTYIEEFTDEQVSAYPGNVTAEFTNQSTYKEGTDQIANIFFQIRAEGDPGEEFVNTASTAGGIIFGSSFAFGATGSLLLVAASNPITAIITTVAVVGGTGGLRAYGTHRNQEISIANCGKFASARPEKSVYGCSIITTVDYNNINLINDMCAGGILGNP